MTIAGEAVKKESCESKRWLLPPRLIGELEVAMAVRLAKLNVPYDSSQHKVNAALDRFIHEAGLNKS